MTALRIKGMIPLSSLRTADEIRKRELAASRALRWRYRAGWLPNQLHILALRIRACFRT